MYAKPGTTLGDELDTILDEHAPSPVASTPRWGRIYLTWLSACAGHPNMLRVLTIISKYAGAKGFAWPSVRRIADEAEISIRQTYYAFAKLRKAGIIAGDEDEYGRGGYRLFPIPKSESISSARKRRQEAKRYDDERHAHTIRENSEREYIHALHEQRDIPGRINGLPDRLKARLLEELIHVASHLEFEDQDSATTLTRYHFYRFGHFCAGIRTTFTEDDDDECEDGYYALDAGERKLFRCALRQSDHAWTEREMIDFVAQLKAARGTRNE